MVLDCISDEMRELIRHFAGYLQASPPALSGARWERRRDDSSNLGRTLVFLPRQDIHRYLVYMAENWVRDLVHH
jgi:hypothetical protein